MQVVIDADALPRALKEIIYKAAKRIKVKWTLVANKHLYVPVELEMDMVTVAKGPDEADDRIVEMVGKGDLVVTSDIPLADRVIAKGACALSPKGEFHTEANIKARLATRNLLDQLRNEGVIKGGGAPFSPKDAQAFANQLDSFLSKRLREETSQAAKRVGFVFPAPGDG
jgi:uncharacterized protein YaiI (UPF0178 family)